MTAGRAKRAWTNLFAEHRPALRGFFARRGAHEEAEDMVQETYLRLLRAHRSQGEAIANPDAYLYTVTTNLARAGCPPPTVAAADGRTGAAIAGAGDR